MTAISDDRAARLREAIRKKRQAKAQLGRSGGTADRATAPEIPPRPNDEPARLGPMQRSLWLAHRLDPESAAYHLVDAYRVRGRRGSPLDRPHDGPHDIETHQETHQEALQDAFRQVVRRHRLLRSTFHPAGDDSGDAVQKVIAADWVDELFAVEVADGHPGEVVEAVAVREARRPFDLSMPPLVRLLVIRGEILMLVLHHILADEHSLGVFWSEMTRSLSGRLPEASAVQHDDYAHWARHQRPATGREELEAWRRRLAQGHDQVPDELTLPFETGAPSPESPGLLIKRPLPAEISGGVRRLAERTDSTPFLVLAFAYGLLLRRYAEGGAPAFASPVSTRVQAGTADMIGYFTNPVVMPTQIDESLDVASALRAFRSEALERLAQASIPFQDLVEDLDPPRAAGRHPIFQTMFVLRRHGAPPDLGSGVELEPITLDLGTSKFDLTLFATENAQDEKFQLAAEFRTDRYHEAGVRRFLSHYEALLRNLLRSSDDVASARPVLDLPIFDDEEARRLESFAEGSPLAGELDLLPRRIHDVSAEIARAGDAPAVVFDGRVVRYGDLAKSAAEIAARLEEAGIGEGDRVGVFLGRSPELIAAVLGCHRAGAAYVPLDPTYPAERNHAVLSDAGVAAVITTGELSSTLPEGAWKTVLVGRDETNERPEDTSPVNVSPASPAYLLYTSGSTGRPKGVVVSQENLRLSTAARLQAYGDLGVRPRRFLLLPSLAFDSSVAGLFWVLPSGDPDALVLPTDEQARDPRALARLIDLERVTSLLCVPPLYAQILRFADGPEALKSLEAVIVAGESCPWTLVQEHFERLPGARLFNEYGPTEATVWATLHEITPGEMDRVAGIEPVSIGRPIPGVRIDLEDEHGRPVPVGIPGHAWIAGPTVTDGYWGRDDLTADCFEESSEKTGGMRRYRTGDRMAWTDDGRLLFLGRADEQIKLRGFRIEPGEIESALLEAGVSQAAVVARPVGDTERLVAFVEGSLPADWRERLARTLPAHMVPSRAVSLDELPKLPNGKIDRGHLRSKPMPSSESRSNTESASTASLQAGGHVEVTDIREQALLSLWRGLLGADDVRLDDNFFEFGGHSLQVAEMALTIERDFGVKIAAADVFQNPTVRRLARQIAMARTEGTARAESYEHLFPIQPSGRGAPFLVCVPHFFSGLFAERFRGERPVYGLRGISLRQEGNLGRWPTMRALAEDLVDEVERRFPEASGKGFLVAGYSFGGSMATEMVRVMEERGVPVRGLYLIAPMPLDFVSVGPLRVQLRPLTKPAQDLTKAEALRIWLHDHDPRTLRPYRYAWRWLRVQPLRRLRCLVGLLRRRLGLPLSHATLHADVRVDRFRLHKRYRPAADGIRIETPTVIFNPDENAETPGTDSAATWRRVFRSLEVVETPDPHRDDASVESAKRVVLDHLQELDGP